MSNSPFAEFPPKVQYLNIHGTIRNRIIFAFDLPNDLTSREHTSRMRSEKNKYLKLAKRQRNGFSENGECGGLTCRKNRTKKAPESRKKP